MDSLAKKLKIKEGYQILTVNAPSILKEKLAPLPEGVRISSNLKEFHQVHWFVKTRRDVAENVGKALSVANEETLIWIYFPKSSSGIQTDLTRDAGWDALKTYPLKMITLVSFDDTWSAFAYRLGEKAKTKKDSPVNQFIDISTKTVKLPDDLKKEFKGQAAALNFFNTLSFTNRKEYVEWVVSAKKEETRHARVLKTIECLKKGLKNPRNM